MTPCSISCVEKLGLVSSGYSSSAEFFSYRSRKIWSDLFGVSRSMRRDWSRSKTSHSYPHDPDRDKHNTRLPEKKR